MGEKRRRKERMGRKKKRGTLKRGGETIRYQERNLLPKEALKQEKEREGRMFGRREKGNLKREKEPKKLVTAAEVDFLANSIAYGPYLRSTATNSGHNSAVCWWCYHITVPPKNVGLW